MLANELASEPTALVMKMALVNFLFDFFLTIRTLSENKVLPENLSQSKMWPQLLPTLQAFCHIYRILYQLCCLWRADCTKRRLREMVLSSKICEILKN